MECDAQTPQKENPKKMKRPISTIKYLLHKRLPWAILSIATMVLCYGYGISAAFTPCAPGTFLCLNEIAPILIAIFISPRLYPIGLWLYYLNRNDKKNLFYEILSWLIIIPGFLSSLLLISSRANRAMFFPRLDPSLTFLLLVALVILTIYCLFGKRNKRHNPKTKMNLQPKYLNYIKNGTKRVELRLYDQKRQKLKVGDIIEFYDDYGGKVICRITELLRYNSFEELVADFDISLLAGTSVSPQELLHDLALFYPPEKQAELGVVGIRFELVAL